MALNLFDDSNLDPNAIEASREKAALAEDARLAAAGPQEQVNNVFFTGARHFGQAVGRATGATHEDPQMAEAKAYAADVKANAPLANTDPVGYLKKMAESAASRGQGDLAAQLSAKAGQLEASLLKAKQEKVQAGLKPEHVMKLVGEGRVSPESAQAYMAAGGDFRLLKFTSPSIDWIPGPDGKPYVDQKTGQPVLGQKSPDGTWKPVLGTPGAVASIGDIKVDPNAPVDAVTKATALKADFDKAHAYDMTTVTGARDLVASLRRAHDSTNPEEAAAAWAAAQQAWGSLISSDRNRSNQDWARMSAQAGIPAKVVDYLSGALSGVPTKATMAGMARAADAMGREAAARLSEGLGQFETLATENKMTPAQSRVAFSGAYAALKGTPWGRAATTAAPQAGPTSEGPSLPQGGPKDSYEIANIKADIQAMTTAIRGMPPGEQRDKMNAALNGAVRDLRRLQNGEVPESDGAHKHVEMGKKPVYTARDLENDMAEAARRGIRGDVRKYVLEQAKKKFRVEGL